MRPSPLTDRCPRRTARAWPTWPPPQRPTSTSVTIRPNAARETKVSRACSYVPPVRSASRRKFRSIRAPVDRSGRQAVHVHPGRSDLEGQRRGQPDHGHLGRAVGRTPDQRSLARDRGEVDHVTVAAGDHGRQERPTDQVDPPNVDREDLVPLLGVDLGQRSDRSGDAGVVDHDGNLGIGQRVGQGGDRSRVGDVADPPGRPFAQFGRDVVAAARVGGPPGRRRHPRRAERGRSRRPARCRRR